MCFIWEWNWWPWNNKLDEICTSEVCVILKSNQLHYYWVGIYSVKYLFVSDLQIMQNIDQGYAAFWHEEENVEMI